MTARNGSNLGRRNCKQRPPSSSFPTSRRIPQERAKNFPDAMEANKKSRRNIQQHFVTAAYLAGFTPDGSRESQLYVYERSTQKMFRSVPDEAAKRRNYYSAPLPQGGFDDTVDTMLTALEGQAMPSLQKLVAGDYNLTTFERALLAFLIAFQEFRTPWTRKIFQKMQEDLTTSTMHMAANQPGYFEKIFEELTAKGQSDESVTPDQLRDALRDGRIKAKAQPHADLHLIAAMGQQIGNIYTRMQWTVVRAMEGEFVTSDAPVVRRDPGFRGGLYGGGLFSPTAEVWFPLSKRVVMIITHDEPGEEKFFELLAAGRRDEAEGVRRQLPPIRERGAKRPLVEAINHQTVTSADRFVFSPFESVEISKLLQGESQNMRIVTSPPPPVK
jgi:hypothetical protein